MTCRFRADETESQSPCLTFKVTLSLSDVLLVIGIKSLFDIVKEYSSAVKEAIYGSANALQLFVVRTSFTLIGAG